MRIYSLRTGEPLHLIGMKGYDNGQFLQPISLCFLQMSSRGGGSIGKTPDESQDNTCEEVHIPVLAVGDLNNRIQVSPSFNL